MKALYYLRSGETKDVRDGIRSRPDTVLTEGGRTQMQVAGGLLVAREIVPGLIVCSDYPRATEGAGIVADTIGYYGSIIRSSLLSERNWGVATGMRESEVAESYLRGFDTVPGAETTEELQLRAAEVTEWLGSVPFEVVLVVGHGTLGHAIIRDIHDRPASNELNGQTGLQAGQVARLLPLPMEMFPIGE